MLPEKDKPFINGASTNVIEMAFYQDLSLVFPPPHPAGRRFILGGLAAAAIGLFVGWWLVRA